MKKAILLSLVCCSSFAQPLQLGTQQWLSDKYGLPVVSSQLYSSASIGKPVVIGSGEQFGTYIGGGITLSGSVFANILLGYGGTASGNRSMLLGNSAADNGLATVVCLGDFSSALFSHGMFIGLPGSGSAYALEIVTSSNIYCPNTIFANAVVATNGSSILPELKVTGRLFNGITNVTSSYTQTTNDYTIVATGSGGIVITMLPLVSWTNGQTAVTFSVINATSGHITNTDAAHSIWGNTGSATNRDLSTGTSESYIIYPGTSRVLVHP